MVTQSITSPTLTPQWQVLVEHDGAERGSKLHMRVGV